MSLDHPQGFNVIVVSEKEKIKLGTVPASVKGGSSKLGFS